MDGSASAMAEAQDAAGDPPMPGGKMQKPVGVFGSGISEDASMSGRDPPPRHGRRL